MSRVCLCPKCSRPLRIPDGSPGQSFRCSSCQTRLILARKNGHLVLQLPGEEVEEFDVELATPPRSKGNILQRYRRWAGTRSLIFQSLLLAWTVCALLGSCGLLFSTLAQKPRTRQDEDAQVIASGFGLMCSCGVYSLLAIPLGIAAIATLERDKARN